jgi:hypothetical protein
LMSEILGHEAVAKTFVGRAQGAQRANIAGAPGLVWAPGGRPFAVFDFVVDNGRIVEISLIADRQSIAALDLEFSRAARLLVDRAYRRKATSNHVTDPPSRVGMRFDVPPGGR